MCNVHTLPIHLIQAMEKRNSNNPNRNPSNFLNHMRGRVVKKNLVTPEIFVSEVWMQEGSKTGIEIVELNASNSNTEEPSQEPSYQEETENFSQVWSFINTNRFPAGSEYEINYRAREKWRRNREELEYANEFLHDHDTQTNFNGFHYIDDAQVSGMQHNPQTNCFTIINNHVINSDCSVAVDQDYDRVEEIETYFVENNGDPQNTYWDHVYNDDLVPYNPTNKEKRTVWIYSFKNQSRLSENDYELVNIPSEDIATSNSSSDDEYKIDKCTYVNRIDSPIPGPFLPRLDLSMAQTLSTVTEVSEIKSNESLVKKPINNWLTERHIPKTKTKSVVPNVIEWMALSPRERRRRFKNTTTDDYPFNQNMKEYTYAEGSSPKKSSIIKVDVEVHATDDVSTKHPTDLDMSVHSGDLVPQVKDRETNTNTIDVTYAGAHLDDYYENGEQELDESTKPGVSITANKTYNIMSDPIVKLDSNSWIGDVATEQQTPDYNSLDNELERNDVKTCINDDNMSDSASRRLWKRRVMLMKSPMWDQYLPITGTPPSIHISMSLSSIESKRSWFKRIGKCLKCCK